MILQLSGEKEKCLCLLWGLSSTPAPGPAHLTCLLLGLDLSRWSHFTHQEPVPEKL